MKRRSLLTAFGGMFVASFPQPSQAIPDDMRKTFGPELVPVTSQKRIRYWEYGLTNDQYDRLMQMAEKAVVQATEELGPEATEQQLEDRAFEIMKQIASTIQTVPRP